MRRSAQPVVLLRSILSSLFVLFLPASFLSAGESPEAASVQNLLRQLGFSVPAQKQRETPGFRIEALTQDYRRPLPDLCCHTLTPVTVGSFTFEKGIGAHANGRIALRLTGRFRRFKAAVGVDNNWDTAGFRGSVAFLVKVNGRKAAETGLCRGGEEPRSLEVPLKGARTVELIVTDGGDGYLHDQADWCAAFLEKNDGSKVYLSDWLPTGIPCPFFTGLVTSFRYNAEVCWKHFARWQKKEEAPRLVHGGWLRRLSWRDPETGFTATLRCLRYLSPPACELTWVLRGGHTRSGLITDMRVLDISAPSRPGASVLVSCTGGLAGSLRGRPEQVGFRLQRTVLGRKTLSVRGGRSSNGDLPFFLLREGASGWGFAAALGWSGNWKADAQYAKGRCLVSASTVPVHFRLPPHEELSVARVLIVPFRRGEEEGANRLRRVLRCFYQPRLSGKAPLPPVSFNTWFTFGNAVNEDLLTELAREASSLGIEYFCLDAGWFTGDFPHGVGNWTVEKRKFPHGLRSLADYVHSVGLKFGLWFEPERVAPNTAWAKKHPELTCGNLLNLGKPQAQKLLVDLIHNYASELNLDWIRYDFNTDPLSVWQAREEPDERGLLQLRHINGLYAVLDQLMQRHPDLLIEQCAGGGRRMDLETVRRGHTFWKSDNTADKAVMRFHETGGNFFLPGGLLNTNCGRFRTEGEVVALCAGPLGFSCDLRKLSPAEKKILKRVIAAYKRVRHLINEDYWQLFPQDTDPRLWNGWEFITPGGSEGFFCVYRPLKSPYSAADLWIRGLRFQRAYVLENILSGETTRLGSAALARYRVSNLDPGQAALYYFHLEEGDK